MQNNDQLLVRMVDTIYGMETRLTKRLEELEGKVDDQSREMSRYKGALGATIFILSCIWAAIVTFKDKLF